MCVCDKTGCSERGLFGEAFFVMYEGLDTVMCLVITLDRTASQMSARSAVLTKGDCKMHLSPNSLHEM